MATITKIPGFGDYGIYVDGVDFDHMSVDEWAEWGKLHIKTCVTIFRNTNCTPDKFKTFNHTFGRAHNGSFYRYLKKYNIKVDKSLAPLEGTNLAWQNLHQVADEADMRILREIADISAMPNVQRVTGKRYNDGRRMGIFAEGELLWHSNESGQLVNNPGVFLLAMENVVGSSTGFCITVNWYNAQTEAFRSELDEMIMEHDFVPGRMNPGLNETQDSMMRTNFSPVPEDIPLVIHSPGGLRGLHFSPHTICRVKGMPQAESDRLIDRIKFELLQEPHIYDHWYQNTGDLLLFDNSITLHRRLGDIKDRLLLRSASSYANLIDHAYQPYFHPEYAERYKQRIMDIRDVMNVQDSRPFLN